MWIEARIAFKVEDTKNESQSRISDAIFKAMTEDNKEDDLSPQNRFKEQMKDILFENYNLKLEGVGVQFFPDDKKPEEDN
jgi:hypothetical protein